jgi:uncharacterized protein YjiS (DUF1127 family)
MIALTVLTAAMRRFLSGLATLSYSAVRSSMQRRALAPLASLDDRMLRDIGLARADVYDAMTLPVGQDAAAFLEDRRRARPAQPALYATELAALTSGTLATQTRPAPASQTELVRRAA